MDGAVYLHEASMKQTHPLDLFIMYGSSSALMGSPGEANYVSTRPDKDNPFGRYHACIYLYLFM